VGTPDAVSEDQSSKFEAPKVSPAPGTAAAPKVNPLRPPGTPSYWLTRFIILRLLGFVYFIAFLVAANQIVPLVGEHGLLPAKVYLERLAADFGSRADGFLQLPSLFWFDVSDRFLVAMAWAGVGLSALVLLGFANAVIMALLWALYMSFVHIGQDWYGYGWEIQLLETGFLGIFLCPLLDGRPFPNRAPPTLVLWLFRWLIFRIMFGAGLIKIRGDDCWRDLTCLYYHYETQPIPSPLSWWLHFRPHWFHKFGVLWNHVVELIVPWFAFGPRTARHVAGALLVSFQVVLILSGNLSFLNWLTIVPALACFDDSLLQRLLPGRLVTCAMQAAEAAERRSPNRRVAKGLVQRAGSETGAPLPLGGAGSETGAPFPVRWEGAPAQDRAAIVLAAVVAALSFFPVANMLSPHQVMNTSFNRLHLVNTYGAFGSVGQVRHEIVFEGTDEALITSRTQWKEYQFKAKPGNPQRRPVFIAPYQPRIDWQIWFAAMSRPLDYPWTLHFIWKLLHNDPQTLTLIAGNPFPTKPPRYIRAQYYRYQFAPPGDPSHAWWKRTLAGSWLPPLSTDDPELRRFLTAYGWLPSKEEKIEVPNSKLQ
jgi:hypothetical protein